MVNKFHYWGLFYVIAVVCFLSFTPASGDEVMCEKDDEDTGVCLYEGWFFLVETLPSADQISCSWGELNDKPAFLCKYIHNPASTLSIEWIPYTFMVLAETEEVRLNRIAVAVDKHIVTIVKRWKEECDKFLAGGLPIIGATKTFTVDDCNNIIKVYNAGFTEPLSYADDSRLLEFKAVDEPDGGYLGRFYWPHYNENGRRAGKIRINIGLLETYENRDYRIRRTVAHERIHLADWIDNGVMQWFAPGKSHELFDLDKTHRWAKFIGEQAGPFPLHWERACSNDDHRVEYFLAGWGHHNEVREGYCFVKMVLTGGR